MSMMLYLCISRSCAEAHTAVWSHAPSSEMATHCCRARHTQIKAMPDPNVVAISARGGATKKNMHFPAKRIRKVELWVVLTKGPFSCSPTRPFDLSVPTNIVLRDILQSSLGSSAPGRSSPNAHNHYFVASKRAIGIWCCSHAALVSHSNKPPQGPVSDLYGLVPTRADARLFSLTREGPE